MPHDTGHIVRKAVLSAALLMGSLALPTPASADTPCMFVCAGYCSAHCEACGGSCGGVTYYEGTYPNCNCGYVCVGNNWCMNS